MREGGTEGGREGGRKVGREGREGGREGRTESLIDGGTEIGKEGRREGTRVKPVKQLVYCICIHLLDPHWTMPRHAVISTQQQTLSH